jgi:serine/threonine-protein kinase RsbT
MTEEIRIGVASDLDIVPARARGRALAGELGFSRTDATLVATAISEIARNIVVHAGHGEIELRPAYERDRRGVVVVARDEGPGIRDVDAALQHGFGTKGGLGLGLPGVRRIMDEFMIETAPNHGTTVTMRIWRDLHELDRDGALTANGPPR